MIKTDVLILGGGLAGLSTAYHLNQSSSLSSLVVEKEAQVGGTAASLVKNGFTFDFTGHLLHLHDPYGKKLITSLLGKNIRVIQRNSWIYSHNVLTRYPFQANTYGLPDSVIDECLFEFLKIVHSPPKTKKREEAQSFQEWALSRFGRGICRHFLFPYNEKLWQRPLSEMTTEWQGRFVPAPQPGEVLCGALMDQTKAFGYNASFIYPKKGGIQALPNALTQRLKAGQVQLQSPVLKVDLNAKEAFVDGVGLVSFKHLVNTLPLTDFLGLGVDIPQNISLAAKRLSYNSVYCLNIGVSGPIMPGKPDRDVSSVGDPERCPQKAGEGKHWIYFPEKKYPFYRVGFYHQFSPNNAPKNSSSLYVEVARNSKETLSFPNLEGSILKSLKECGILKAHNKILVKEWVPIRCAYVIYDLNRTPALKMIFSYLQGHNASSIGRYGAWKYSFMEEAILDGKKCAEELAKGV